MKKFTHFLATCCAYRSSSRWLGPPSLAIALRPRYAGATRLYWREGILPIEVEVQKRARELADVMHTRRQSAVEKRAELKAELEALDAELSQADDAEERLASFRPTAEGAAVCPYCWMYETTERPLLAIGRPPEDDRFANVDFYRCEACNNRYTSEPIEEPSA